jgi:outer membrane lipoprotein-sorting protein
MFRNVALLAFACALVPHTAGAQDLDLDEILANYYEAIGGLDAWKSVESTKVTGKMSMRRGMEVPFTRLVKRPDKIRMEFTMQGMTGIRASDGETAWMLMPFRGGSEPEVIEGPRAQGLRDDADIDGLLVGYEEDGYEVELVGLETTEGTEAYKLKVTKKEKDVEYWYLDAEYFIPIMTEVHRSFQGNETVVQVIISDYEEVDGLMMAHSFQTRREGGRGGPGGQAVTMERIELNVEIDDSVFAMPGKGESQ